MAREARRVPYEEFIGDPERQLERVARGRETIVVERPDGVRVLVRRAPAVRPRRRREPGPADEAFLSAFGGWRGLVDADALKGELAAARGSRRPPVEL